MVVESLVYFDQISKNSDNDDHEHGNINIFSAIFNIENIITGAVFSAIAYSLSSAFLSSGILSSSLMIICRYLKTHY